MSGRVTLGSACEAIVDCEHKTAPIDEAGECFAVGTPAMRDGEIDYSQARRISAETFEGWTRRMSPRAGDLLFAREAPVGPIVRIPATQNVAPGQRTVLLRPDQSQVESNFLYYLLRSPFEQRRLQERAAGSTVAHLNVADVRAFELPVLPSLDHQVAIAEVLGALDDKIAANRKLAETADHLAAALFRDAAAGGVERELRDVTQLLTRGVAPKYTEDESELLVLNQKCVRDQRVALAPARRTMSDKVSADKRLRQNDVLVNSTGAGTLGRVARWTLGDDATADSHVSIVRFDNSLINPVCAGFAVLHAQKMIEMMGEGSTGQTELSRDQLGKLRLRFIGREQEARVAPKLESLTSLSVLQLAESSTLSTLRDTLLPRLMSGELRIRDAERQVSAVL